jgi:hypothetical protein
MSDTEPGTRIIGKIRLFEDFLGMTPSPAQAAIAAATAVYPRVNGIIADPEQSDDLIYALALWWSCIGGTDEIVVYTDTDERARQLHRGIWDIHAGIEGGWRRPMSQFRNNAPGYYFEGGGGVDFRRETDFAYAPRADRVVIDGADRRSSTFLARLRNHRSLRDSKPSRQLFLSDKPMVGHELGISDMLTDVAVITA